MKFQLACVSLVLGLALNALPAFAGETGQEASDGGAVLTGQTCSVTNNKSTNAQVKVATAQGSTSDAGAGTATDTGE